MERPNYDIGSRNSFAMGYLSRQESKAKKELKNVPWWNIFKYIKCLIKYNFWKKQYDLACKEMCISPWDIWD